MSKWKTKAGLGSVEVRVWVMSVWWCGFSGDGTACSLTHRDVSGGAQQEVGQEGEEGRVESIDRRHRHQQPIGQTWTKHQWNIHSSNFSHLSDVLHQSTIKTQIGYAYSSSEVIGLWDEFMSLGVPCHFWFYTSRTGFFFTVMGWLCNIFDIIATPLYPTVWPIW